MPTSRARARVEKGAEVGEAKRRELEGELLQSRGLEECHCV
jgi:hypothetical protein